MKYLLGIVAIVSCIVLSTFDSFPAAGLTNVAWWGVGISIIYMILSAMEDKLSPVK